MPARAKRRARAAVPRKDRLAPEEPYRLLFDGNPLPMWVFDAETLRFLAVNDAMVAKYGWSREELLDRTCLEVRPPEERERLKDYLAHPPERPPSGVWSAGRWRHLRRDGGEMTVEISWSRIVFRGRDAFLVLANDVSDRLAAEARLRRREEQLRLAQKMDAVGRLAGGVAHEFNNILTGIVGLATLVRRELGADHPSGLDVDKILQASRRAADLVGRLLVFGRRGSPRRVPLSLNRLVTDNRKMLEAILGERIELKTVLEPALPRVLGDAGRLEQVLVNLCLNARDAMRGSGTIVVETKTADLPSGLSTPHGSLPAGRFASLVVYDTGAGIAPEHGSHIFEPFFTTKGVGEGTGLGLSIVYSVVQDHDGAVDFHSKPGLGTLFRVLLPSSAESPEDAPREAPEPRGGRETLLVAEDDPLVRSTLARVLEEAGYTLLLARDGEEAVHLFEAHAETVSLVLLDVVMPRLTGDRAFERIHALRPAVRALFMSGHATAQAEGAVRKYGIPLLAKPFDPGAVLREIRAALDS